MTILEIFKGYKNFIISSHDAGGGNVLSSLVQKLGIADKCFFIVDGPSKAIYEKKFKHLKKIDINIIASFDPRETFVMTSTSGNAELERSVLLFAKLHHFKTVSILDHWSNFKIRFVPVQLRKNTEDLFLSLIPDFILVTDVKAKLIAEELSIPKEKLIEIENPYLEDLKNRYKEIAGNIKKKNQILYMSEYFTSSKNSQLNELDYLKDILSQLKVLLAENKKEIEFYIRLHPTEESTKYDSLLASCPFLRIGSKDTDLLEDLATSKLVIGKSSMGLIVSSMLGIPTYSYNNPQFDFINLENGIVVLDSIDQKILNFF